MEQASIPISQPIGFTGGVDLPGVVQSLSNLRILRSEFDSRAFTENQRLNVVIPNVGYIKNLRLIFEGTLTVTLGTGSATAGDPRKLLREVAYSLQSTNRLRALDGIAENIIETLDYQVLNPKQTFTVAGGPNPVYLEWSMQLPISEANLLGISYIGGGTTYAALEITQGAISDIVTLAGGATATLTGTWRFVMDWIDAEAPRAPREITVTNSDGKPERRTIPGQGLWRETSRIKQTQVLRSQVFASAGQEVAIDLPLGFPYLRIVLISYENNIVDSDDTLIQRARIELQQQSKLRDESVRVFDMIHRQTFFKSRPGGVYVFSFIDMTGSDRDILRTDAIGRMVLWLTAGTATPPATNRVDIITEQLVPLQNAGRL